MVTSRRKFLAASGVASMLSLLPANSFAQEKKKWPGFIDTDEMHTVPFIDQYYDGMMAIVRGIRDTQIDNIATAMEKAYECHRNGGTICSNAIVFTHDPSYELHRDRPGQPWLFPAQENTLAMDRESYGRLKKGDFVLACRNTNDKSELDARNRGVYIAGVTNAFFKFSRTPEGILAHDQLAVEDYANTLIDSMTTGEVGLVKSPKLHFKFCPAGATAIFLVYWACTASFANLIATGGRGSSSEPAKQYLDMALERGEMIGMDRPKIIYETEKWVDIMLNRNGRLLMYGQPMMSAKYNVTEPGNVFCNASTGAGSCQTVLPYTSLIKNPETDIRNDDIIILAGISSDHPAEIEVARTARRMGAHTVAFCPFETEGDHPDNRLFREVDVAFNTYSPERAGVFEAKGFMEKVSPLTTITGSFLNWMLTAQWADHMAQLDELPYFRCPWVYHDSGNYNNNIVVTNAAERGY